MNGDSRSNIGGCGCCVGKKCNMILVNCVLECFRAQPPSSLGCGGIWRAKNEYFLTRRGGKYSFFAQPPTAPSPGQWGTQLTAKPRPTYTTHGGRTQHVYLAVPLVKRTFDDLIVEVLTLFGMHRDIVEIKFRGNENSVLQMALDFATKWQVHHYGHPRSGNVPQNVQKPFLVCNGHPTSIFPDF